MKTIAEQLNVTDIPFEIKDKEGRVIYFEKSDKYWARWEHDSSGNVIYYENSDEEWDKYEYDSEGHRIYWESSDGVMLDKRPKLHDVITLNGIRYKRIDE